MKKRRILVVTIFIITLVVITIKNSFVKTTAKQAEEVSQDILYQDVIITALAPTINTAIEDYYTTLLTDTIV